MGFFDKQKDCLQHPQSESDAHFALHDVQMMGDIRKGMVSVGGGVFVWMLCFTSIYA